MRLKLAAIVLFGASILNAQPLAVGDKEYKDVVDTGKEATKLLLETLQKNMQEHMKQGGVMGALDFCSNEASTLTQKVNSQLQEGVNVKRVSMKSRNPSNQAQNDEEKVLLTFENLQKEGQKVPEFSVEKVDEHTFKFYKPLTINKPVCLICHGDLSSNKQLKKAIADKNSSDRAYGYTLNDLRGTVVVTIKK